MEGGGIQGSGRCTGIVALLGMGVFKICWGGRVVVVLGICGGWMVVVVLRIGWGGWLVVKTREC